MCQPENEALGPQDRGEVIATEEWNRAIDHLIQNCPEEAFMAVQALMREKGEFYWGAEIHHTFGMYVRNLLREAGFEWGDIVLDNIWVELFEDALHKKRALCLPSPLTGTPETIPVVEDTCS